MNILIDCSRLIVGGGLQVGLAILANAVRETRHAWFATFSTRIAAQCSSDIKRMLSGFKNIPCSTWPLIQFIEPHLLSHYERHIQPDVTFTVFGPTLWKAHSPQLVGFAYPHLLYPEVDVHHSVLWRTRTRWAGMRLHYQKDRLWVVETETVKQRLHSIFMIPQDSIFVVRNSYSPQFMKTFSETESHEKPSDRFTIFVPSAPYPHKNLSIIPEVAQQLKKSTQQPFIFILSIPETCPEWQRIQSKAKELNVGTEIRTEGTVNHHRIASLYKQAQAVFLPTLLECSTAVYPESFISGVPLATSDRDFARELCEDAAIYFDPLSPSSAAQALYTLITDSTVRENLTQRGKQILKKNYPSPDEKWATQLQCIERFEK